MLFDKNIPTPDIPRFKGYDAQDIPTITVGVYENGKPTKQTQELPLTEENCKKIMTSMQQQPAEID